MVPPPLRELGPRTRSITPPIERALPFVVTLRGYSSESARHDFVAGLTTALFAIPQGMAYALIAGFPPSAGIATSVAASILGAAFGSSEFLINGPTNAISVMIAGNVSLFAANGDPITAIVLLTMLIGLAQVLFGLLRVGTLTRFVSEAVLAGFTAGAGLYIVINQLPHFLGVPRAKIADDLWGWVPPKSAAFDLLRVLSSSHGLHAPTLWLSLSTFALVRGLQRLEPRIGRKLPAPFLAVVAVTIASVVLELGGVRGTGVRTIADIEPLTRALPSLRLPSLDVPHLRELIEPAFAIGLMGAVEAIAIGKSLAVKAGHRFDASKQLIGEGFCNVAAALVGGFASSGSFSRTAVNYEAGARTRISCILSGVLTMIIVLAAAPLANRIPIAALAGTLVHIGLKLVDVGRLRMVFSSTTGDRAVLSSTFAAVLLAEHLESALFIGIAVSVFYALRRAEGFKLQVLTEREDGTYHERVRAELHELGDVALLNLQGELFFAAADELTAELTRILDGNTRFLVLRVQEAYNLDATSAEALAQLATKARQRGGRLVLCGVRPGMYGTFERAGVLAKLGEENVFRAEGELLSSTRRALRHAHALADRART